MVRVPLFAFTLIALLARPTTAQVPHIQVYFDPAFTQTQFQCVDTPAVSELYVVLSIGMLVGAVDFSIAYPNAVTWLTDETTSADLVKVGNSPDGIALTWDPCCMPDGRNGPILVLKPLIQWSGNCNFPVPGCFVPLTVGGYTPLGKPHPSVVRYPDLTEHQAYGMTSLIHGDCVTPVEPTTWGRVKALYR